MSKLSESVKAMQEEDLKKDFNKSIETDSNVKRICDEIYEKISNVEFSVLESVDNYYIEIYPFLEFENTLVIKLSKGRTSCYEIGMFPNSKQPSYLVGKYPLKKDAIEKDGNFIDLGELLYFCSKKAKSFPTDKSNLAKEIDEGFKNPTIKSTDSNGRVSLGGETLEEDVAFNEWMHKRFK